MQKRVEVQQDKDIATKLWFLESKEVILHKLKMLEQVLMSLLKFQQKVLLRRTEK